MRKLYPYQVEGVLRAAFFSGEENQRRRTRVDWEV